MAHGIKAGWITVHGSEAQQGDAGSDLLSVGGQKQSGIGTEGGMAGMVGYTTSTAVQLLV